MEEVSSIAFGAHLHGDGEYPNFGTCHESRNTYNDQGPGDDFMGPTLWTSDPEIFGHGTLMQPSTFSLFGMPVDLGSHIDMLHEFLSNMGIAWEEENVYWVFDGMNNSIDRVDFAADHDVGFDDHSDGIITQYIKGEVQRTEDIPSHLEYDPGDGLSLHRRHRQQRHQGARHLWIPGRHAAGHEPAPHHNQDDALVWTLIEGDALARSASDLRSPRPHHHHRPRHRLHPRLRQRRTAGGWLDTELGGALMGIWGKRLFDLWFVNARDNKVIRLQAVDAPADTTEAYEDV